MAGQWVEMTGEVLEADVKSVARTAAFAVRVSSLPRQQVAPVSASFCML